MENSEIREEAYSYGYSSGIKDGAKKERERILNALPDIYRHIGEETPTTIAHQHGQTYMLNMIKNLLK